MDAISLRHANRDCSKSIARKICRRAFNSQTVYRLLLTSQNIMKISAHCNPRPSTTRFIDFYIQTNSISVLRTGKITDSDRLTVWIPTRKRLMSFYQLTVLKEDASTRTDLAADPERTGDWTDEMPICCRFLIECLIEETNRKRSFLLQRCKRTISFKQ